MDDRRFDSLVKSLAGGASRRTVLKGLLGLGGAAAVGGTLLEGPAEAARRPTPTPTPIRCPGNQTPGPGGVCTCPPSAPHQCNPGTGPACCTDVPGGPPLPTHTECCDNACCHGTCYGEELCCPTNNRSAGDFPIPPTHRICDTNAGPECCPFDNECCLVDGCCETICYGGSVDADFCCPVEDFCAGGSETDGICCTGNTTCCHGGTNQRVCLDLSAPDACCDEGDCGDPCKICNQESHTCVDRCDPETQVCCTEQAGPGVCLDAECCPGVPCTLSSDDDDEDTGICCDGQCLPPTEVCNGGTCCPGGFCDGNGDCCPAGNVGCNGGTCCDGFCDGNGDCCPEGNFGCNGGKCCSVECDRQGNCPCSEADPCDEGDICCDGTCLSGTDNFTCGDGCCPIADTCCEGECCTGECLRYSEAPDVCCTTLACLEGEARECCPNVEDYKCCGTKGCCTSSACNEEADVCCNDTHFACGLVEGNECCDIETQKCCGGLCIPASECCPSTDGDCPTCEPNCFCGDGVVDPATDGLDCNGGIAAGGGVCACGWCVVPLDGCPCGCAGDTECVQCDGSGGCDPINQGGSCNGGAGVCDDVWCVDAPPSCEPNCDCSIPANDGLECNGGGGPVCGCGYCVVPLGDCLCGCDGDTECITCEGGQCVLINQGGACNSGAGVCIDAYCDNCRLIGGDCTVDGQCCAGLCSDAGTCVNCKPDGDSCTSGTECCGFGCANGLCFTT